MNNNCLFCGIIEKRVPADIVFENETVVAFMDIHPTRPGHLLVVPKTHAKNVFDASWEALEPMFQFATKIAGALVKAVSADGVNFIMNNGSASGQMIFHSHLHLVPRFADDGLRHWPAMERTKEDIASDAEKIREELKAPPL
ncbi:MAG: HIT family protein [Patescibacteria group bacterium]